MAAAVAAASTGYTIERRQRLALLAGLLPALLLLAALTLAPALYLFVVSLTPVHVPRLDEAMCLRGVGKG